MLTVKYWSSLLAVVLCAFCVVAQDDVTAEGTGQGSNREEALINAKRAAIEKGIGMILLSQTEVENFMIKRDQIVTKTIGSVKSFDVLSETKDAGGYIEIKIKAVLSKSSMRSDLAAFHILLESMDKPKVMVLITESNVGNDEPSNSSAETAIIGFLKDPYEFDLVDPQVAASIRSSREKMAQVAGNPAEAASIGAKYGAEVVITGSAVSRKADGMTAALGGMVSVQADITLRAVNCTNGSIIGTADGHAAKVHISPNTAGNQALAKAATTAAGKLLDNIMKSWQNQLNNGVGLTVSVKNVSAFRQKKDIIATLQGIAGVSAIRERSWDAQSQILEIDVQYKGNADGFAEKADGLKLKAGGGSLAVSGIEGQRVSINAQVM
jgi:hypothetical protein